MPALAGQPGVAVRARATLQGGGQGLARLSAMGRNSRKSQTEPAAERAQAAIAAALNDSAGGVTTLSVRAARPLGTLWAGYGTITEVETDGEDAQTLIVKVGCS